MALVQQGFTDSAPSAAPAAPVSRLAQMQARIQQRQLQEKEQKLLQLYESQQQRTLDRVVTRSTSLSSSLSSSTSISALGASSSSVRTSLSNGISGSGNGKALVVGAGRVRQMFDERRKPNNSAPAATGWDRSHPLEPIAKPASTHKPVTKTRTGTRLDRTAAPQKAPAGVGTPPPPHQPVRRAKSQAPTPGAAAVSTNTAAAGVAPTTAPDSPPPVPADEELQRYLDDLTPPPSPPPVEDDQEERDAASPDDDAATAATEFVFQKLPNVGGPARAAVVQVAEERPDRFKTYAAGRPAPRGKPAAARGQPAPKAPAKKAEVKASPPAGASPAALAAKRSTTSRGSTSPQHFYSTSRTTSNASTPSKSSAVSNTSTPPKKSPSPAVTASTGAPSSRGKASGSANTSSTPLRAIATVPPRDDLVECSICGRHFATDRVAKHEEICRRTAAKKRKVFDPVKHRVQGTEAEAFVRKMLLKGPPTRKETQAKKPDWRKKHEEFIATIRAAKEMKAHLAAGGKLSDLPPPPPLDTSDYIQCPHCKRRFNESAAERHIPRCANMQHNKKPAQPTRASTGKVGARRR